MTANATWCYINKSCAAAAQAGQSDKLLPTDPIMLQLQQAAATQTGAGLHAQKLQISCQHMVVSSPT
jgi:hypothetical protein